MDIAKPIGSEITSVDFTVLSDEEVRALSVKQITNPQVFDNLGHPIAAGLYDLSLGAFLRNICATCGLDEKNGCPGHQGHIELPVPVYNPLFFSQMYNFLRASCVFCHRFKLSGQETHLFRCRLRLLQYGLLVECDELDNIRVAGQAEVAEDDEEDADEQDNSALVDAREEFVDRVIRERAVGGPLAALILEERKKVVHSYYSRLATRPKCQNCKMFSPGYRKDGVVKIFEKPLAEKQATANRVTGLSRVDMVSGGGKSHNSSAGGSKYVLSSEVKNLLNAVFHNEQDIIQVLFNSRPRANVQPISAEIFFRSTIVVPPTRFRLPSKLGEEVHENALNELLSKVLRTALLIKTINQDIIGAKHKDSGVTLETKKTLFNRLMNAFVTLQNDVNSFVDSTKNQNPSSGKLPVPGIKQALEKKEGLFRKHMMGKRVNYAARSVISPDPMLETNQVGVPPVFAKRLSFPEPVTAHNISEMRQAVINGPDKWPGALQVQNEDGTLVSLVGMSLDQRKALAAQLLTPSGMAGGSVNKKVHRHLKNNDMVLMNRQPTLHKASIMGHRVKVLPGEKTLRIHYANTGAYNADFDGDEMNMHFPQSHMAQAEARIIASTDSQYLTPTAGSPVRGLIQDHISAGVWLTSKDTFFTREQMQEYIYGCLRPEDGHTVGKKIITLPPTVWRPVPLWTGKQLVSTILMNIKPLTMPGLNLESKNKIKNEYWGKNSEENKVLFRKGMLLCGVLDKSQYGASKYGFVHAVHELYGAETAGKLLSILGRLFTNYIQATAFTCGMEDIYLTKEGNRWRNEILADSVDVGRLAAAEVAQLDEKTKENDPELLKRLEEIIRDDNKLAILDAITQSKVERVTSKVISTVIPAGTGKKFPHNAMQSMALSGAKGSAVNVSQIMCLLGQQSLEGRRVPLMVSGKTLPSFKPFETDARAGGYIKNRFYSGIRPQEYYFHCMAGREGLIDTAVKTARSGYLQRCLIKQLEGIHVSYDNTVRDSDGSMVQFLYGGDSVDTTKESYLKQFDFCYENSEGLKSRYDPAAVAESLNIDDVAKYSKKLKKFYKKLGKLQDQFKHFEDPLENEPVISKFNPSKYIGAVSSTFQRDLRSYIKNRSDLFDKKAVKKNNSISDAGFEALMHLKYMRSLVNPGEAVGIIAAQSIGEPSTQMTLNTFHFAGHGAANVTLGIPRLREIVMTASASIQTPQMYLPVLPDITDEQAEIFCKSVAKIKFSELVDNVEVTETTGDGVADATRTYSININFFSRKDYDEEYNVQQSELELCSSTAFLMTLEQGIKKELSNQKKKGHLSSIEIGQAVPKSQQESASQKMSGDDDNDDEDEKAKSHQAVSYDEPDDDEVEIMRQAEKSDSEIDDDEDAIMKDNNSNEENNSDEEQSVETAVNDRYAFMSQDARDRQSQIVSGTSYISKFNFDDANGEWCSFTLKLPAGTQKLLMVDLVEETCRKVVIREIQNIGRCIFPKPEGGKRSLTTEGVNFKAMFDEHEVIDVNNITSNDIAAVLRTYGVEAARNSIVAEINRVFATYAISVSSRHLDLIADFMTREGSYLAFNRQGIDSSTSAFKKMSYETTCQFLTKAVLNNEREELDSPSAKLVIGNLAKVGTGSFDVLAKMPVF